MLRIAENHARDLLAEPESGMGYQLVEATRLNGQRSTGIAFNAELLVFDDERATLRASMTHAQLVAESRSSATELRSLRIIQRTRAATAVHEGVAHRAGGGPAKDAPLEATTTSEVFKRFSAYKDDKRVRPDKGLLAGTYATTDEDARSVHTGRDAVARYALPNPAPASYVFTIRPHDGTIVQRGITEPAVGQPGGGAEVIFSTGTQPATVNGPVKLPD